MRTGRIRDGHLARGEQRGGMRCRHCLRSTDEHVCRGTTATAATATATLERRSHAGIFNRYLRAHSVRVAVHGILSRQSGHVTGPDEPQTVDLRDDY